MGCAQSNVIQDDFFDNSPSTKSLGVAGGKVKPDSNREIKVLLLGASQSGKSTILRQMKLAYEGKYTQQELALYREAILTTTIQSLRDVLEAMPRLNLRVLPSNNAHRTTVLESAKHYPIPRPLADAMRILLDDPNVKDAISKSRWFQFNDSDVYYFDAIDRISSIDYCPTDSDILHTYTKTMGISETTFKVANCSYRVFDVGGTRSQRRKWIHCFGNTSAVIFLVALSEYNQRLYEDESANRMQESLTLFNSIFNSRWFADSTMILLLNKVDLLTEKLQHSPLCEFFPDFTGGADYEAACVYLLRRFASLVKSPTKQIYAHYVCATDPQQGKVTINEIQDNLMENQIKECNSL